MSVFTDGPFWTEAEASTAAHLLIKPSPARPVYSVLSAEENRQLLMIACADAGIEVGDYDARILAWLANFEDSTCAVIAGLITRARYGTTDREREG